MVDRAIKDANVLVSKCFTEYKEIVPEYEIANAFAMLPLLLAKIDQQAARITELEDGWQAASPHPEVITRTEHMARKWHVAYLREKQENKKMAARIKELEKMLYSAIGQIAWSVSIETGRMPDKMGIDFLDWQVPPEIKKTWIDWAARQLRAMPEEAEP